MEDTFPYPLKVFSGTFKGFKTVISRRSVEFVGEILPCDPAFRTRKSEAALINSDAFTLIITRNFS